MESSNENGVRQGSLEWGRWEWIGTFYSWYEKDSMGK